jgi:RNA polymerase sigma-70 factor (ECF subfamily)
MDHGLETDDGAADDPVTQLFTRLRSQLAGTAYHVLGHREDAREAVQDAFVKCWRKRDQVPGIVNLEAWVFSVVLNTAKDLRRRRRVRHTDALPTEDAMGSTARGLDPAHVAERREALDRVRHAIRELPEKEREVFLLRQNGDLSFQAIAEVLDAPVGTVKTRMRTALQRLRVVLDGVGPLARGSLSGGSLARKPRTEGGLS